MSVSNPLIARLLAQVGTFRPLLSCAFAAHAILAGVAVTSQILCISITLNKGYYVLFNCYSVNSFLLLRFLSYRMREDMSSYFFNRIFSLISSLIRKGKNRCSQAARGYQQSQPS